MSLKLVFTLMGKQPPPEDAGERLCLPHKESGSDAMSSTESLPLWQRTVPLSDLASNEVDSAGRPTASSITWFSRF